MDDPERTGEAAAPLKGATLIAGPTASGKSALALRLAREAGGVVVNADSMQVYGVLRVLTARPDDADLAAVPHLLYGHVAPGDVYSSGRYMRDVAQLAREGAFDGRPPVFVGGTGLYFRALLEGLSAMPPVPAAIRERLRGMLAQRGAPAMHDFLRERDPVTAQAVRREDGQRIVRALEVLEASGRPISHWQRIAGRPLIDRDSARLIVLEPDRAVLARRIARRFDEMVRFGALAEVRALAALGLDPSVPAMKAIGVRELLAADRGEIGFDEAIERAVAATRQYAKRQSTWFRGQFGPEWQRVPADGNT